MAQTQISTYSTDKQATPDSYPVAQNNSLLLKKQEQAAKSRSNLIQISSKILEQPITLIANMSQDIFTQESKLMPKSTIGKHIRYDCHCLYLKFCQAGDF
jgi:hypothetical protein